MSIIPKLLEVKPLFNAEFIYLGWWNLYFLLKFWEEVRDDDTITIRRLKRMIAECDSIEAVRKTASETDHPEFHLDVDYKGNPIPCSRESKNREQGTTTFNMCGWCKNCVRFSSIHMCGECNISGICEVTGKEVLWDSECPVTKGTQKELDAHIKRVKKELKNTERHQAHAKANIEKLAKLMGRSVVKPPFANWRSTGHFVTGEDIIIFTEDGFLQARITEITSFGEVVMQVETKRYRDYERNPSLLNKNEFEYLKKHPRYRKLWFKVSNAPSKMSDAFANLDR